MARGDARAEFDSCRRATAEPERSSAIAAALLAWYDRERRHLPWRAGPGERADPYRVWLSEIMLQQTTVKAVLPRYARSCGAGPTSRRSPRAELGEVLAAWAGLGYYARARNLHACARAVVEQHGGSFPADRGRAAQASGHRRLYRRRDRGDRLRRARDAGRRQYRARRRAALRRDGTLCPTAKAEIKTLAETLTPDERAGDFAQAMMDLGATICTPRRPACGLCPVRPDCSGYAQGLAEVLALSRGEG